MYYGKVSEIIVMVKVALVHPLSRVKASEMKDPISRQINHVLTDVFPDTSGNPRVRHVPQCHYRPWQHISLPLLGLYFTVFALCGNVTGFLSFATN